MLINGFNATRNLFNLWFVKFDKNVVEVLVSRRKGYAKSDVIRFIRLSDKLPFIILSAVYCKSNDISCFICTIILISDCKLLIYWDITSSSLNFSIKSASSTILGCRITFLASSMLTNLQIDAKKSYLLPASSKFWLIFFSYLSTLSIRLAWVLTWSSNSTDSLIELLSLISIFLLHL